MNALSLESMRRLAGVSAVAASLVAAVGSMFVASAAYGAEVEACHSDCEDNLDDNTDDKTECVAISAKGTDLAAKMAAVWGPLGGGAAKSGAPASRTGGMLKLRCAGNGPNGLPASFQVAGAYGPVRVHLTKIGPGATEAGRSGVAESKSDDDGSLGLYVPRGTPTWTVGLGRDAAGQFAGQLELRTAALYASNEVLTASSVELHRDTRATLDTFRNAELFQVMAKECLAEIADSPTGGPFRVSFYLPSQVLDEPGTNGEYIVSSNAVPFVEYAVSTVTNGDARAVRIVERREGEVASELEFFHEEEGGKSVFGVSEGGGLRTRRLRVLSESLSSRTVLDTVSGPDGVVVRETLREYRGYGGREVLTLSVDDPHGEARTNRYEYTLGGYVSRHVAPSGLVTEYTYDSDNRRTSVAEHVPGGALPRRRRTYSYAPIGVRPHVPDSTGEDVADDTGDEDFFTPRVETEYVGDVAVSKTLRFISTDTMNHRIVEEVRLADPSATNLAAEWNNPANARRYVDYMPYDRCKPCSERPALVVRENGVVEKYEYIAGAYGPSPALGGSGNPMVFTPMAGGKWFRTVKTRYPAGGVTLSGGSAAFEAVPFRTTRETTVEVRSSKKVVYRETSVFDGLDYASLSRTYTTLDAEGRELFVSSSDGSSIAKTWTGRRLASETDMVGVLTTYAYDALGRVVSAVRTGGGVPAETTTTSYDAEGRVLSRTVSAGGLSRTTLRSYDSLGRLVSETAEDGVVTRRFYSNDRHSGTETVATVRGWGADCAITNSTVSYADGRLLSSALNGVVKTAVVYGADEDGTTWERTCLGPAGTNSPRWTLSRTSPLGHEVETRSPGFGGFDLVTSNFYNVAGQLLATQTFGGEDEHVISSRLYSYDSFGERILDVTDLDLDGEIDWTTDRIASNDVRYVSSGGAWWRESTAWAARTDGSDAFSPVSGSRTRLTGLGASLVLGGISAEALVSETVSADAFGNETTSRVWRVRSACAETRERTVPGSSLPERAELVRGREVSRRSSTGVETTTEYDALGRVVAVEDGRGNVTTTAYDANGRVASVTDGAGNATAYGYDAIGRRVSETDPNGLVTTTAYDAEGRVVSRRGATYPVDYEYDGFGDRVAMATYRDAALAQGDVTLWLRDDATGLVTNKVYADGAGPTYAYTPDGRLALRTWARGVSTSYSYDGAGNLVSTTYSDDTPSISCAYDRSGNIVSAVTDGVATNLYAYSSEGLVTNEVQNGATLVRSYDSLGRPTGYTLSLCASASLREVSFSYDALGRLFTVASGTNLFTYSYLLGTDLVSGYTCGGFSRTVAYDPYRDLVSAITNRFGSRVISTFEYTNDAAGRRTAISRGGDAMGPLSGATDAYGYNGRNEVVSARRTLGGSPVAGFDEDFAYDPIGNRISAADYDEAGAARTSLYTANSLNQYTSRTVPGWASVRGLANADATVAVNGNLAYALASGDIAYFFGSDDFENSAAGGFAELEVSATMSDGTNDFVSVATNRVFVPPANETYAYDADGNQTLVTTATGAWQVEYNGENRPVRWTCGDKTILMTFDHQGRRRLYVEVAAGVTNKLHRFTYNDYVCIARNREIDAQHGVGSDAFVWDPTEPMATRPLMCNPATAPPFLYCHDGNKNVSEIVSLYGTITAHYEYSSFGKVVLVTSENEGQSTANLNPYRFSSEYADDALGLVYYNYRHYNPCDGRWSQRDRISEVIGDDSSTLCLYNFVENDPISLTDIVGFFVNPNWPPVLPSRTTPKSVPAKFVNPNWPPVSPSRSRRKAPRPGAKFVRSQVVDRFGTEIAFKGLDYVMGLCDGPCEKMGECMACCNTVANVAMGLASAKYVVDSIGCVRSGHPVLLVLCIASAGKSYSDSVDRILQAQSDCLRSCWDNPL